MKANQLFIVLLIVCAAALLAGVANAQESGVVLGWTIPTERENGEALSVDEIGGYEIRYSVDGGDTETVIVPDGSATGYQLEGLTGGDYQFSIAAYDVNGLYSEFVPLDAQVYTSGPLAVSGLSVSVVPSADPAEVCAESPRCRVDVLSARYGAD